MLKGIDPRLNADVLYALRDMGHGDTIVLVDTNFPAGSTARETAYGEVLRMENISLPQAVGAVLSVMPLDVGFPDFAVSMEVVGAPNEVPPVMVETQAVIDAAEGSPGAITGVERFAFYDLAKQAYAVIYTGETRFYGNVVLRKGVIPPET